MIGGLFFLFFVCALCFFFFFKQKTAYEMRISDWSSDVCSSDLACAARPRRMPSLFGRFSARRAPARWISRNISAKAAPFVSPGPRGVKRAARAGEPAEIGRAHV